MNFKIFKKNSFTLLELLAAIFLMSLMFYTCFQSYFNFLKKQSTLKETQNKIFNRQYFQFKINNIFSNLVSKKNIKDNKIKTSIYTTLDNHSNIEFNFFFNNGVDPDPLFSGDIFGKLILEEDKLIFFTFPTSEEKDNYKKETILEGVKTYELAFIGAPNPSLLSKKIISKNIALFDTWPSIRETLPKHVEIKATLLNGHKIEFAFFIPND